MSAMQEKVYSNRRGIVYLFVEIIKVVPFGEGDQFSKGFLFSVSYSFNLKTLFISSLISFAYLIIE